MIEDIHFFLFFLSFSSLSLLFQVLFRKEERQGTVADVKGVDAGFPVCPQIFVPKHASVAGFFRTFAPFLPTGGDGFL